MFPLPASIIQSNPIKRDKHIVQRIIKHDFDGLCKRANKPLSKLTFLLINKAIIRNVIFEFYLFNEIYFPIYNSFLSNLYKEEGGFKIIAACR